MQIVRIDPKTGDFNLLWYHMSPFLKDWDKWNMCVSLEEFKYALFNRKYIVWAALKDLRYVMFHVMEIAYKEKEDVLVSYWGCGELDDRMCEEWQKEAELYCKQENLKAIIIEGRPGWSKKFQELGYKVPAWIYRKEIT